MNPNARIEQIAGLVALAILTIGCFLVLRPFLSALLWAAILCYSTWPLYISVKRICGGRQTLAAVLMTILVAAVLVGPVIIVGLSLAESITRLIAAVQVALAEGPPDPPRWLPDLPLVGAELEAYWASLAHDGERLTAELNRLIGPARDWLLRTGVDLGQGILQLSLSVFTAFFFFRHGTVVGQQLSATVQRIAGHRAEDLLRVAEDTVTGVVYGILGTALAQGLLAAMGLWIAGVPGALFLGFLTFFLSFIPMGPPFVWVPATIWLLFQGETGWAIFLALWGFLVVSGVDNFIKPYLISRQSRLSLLLVFLGVLGGLIAFGFIGIFLGPTLLAIAYSLLQEWSAVRRRRDARAA